MTLETIENLSAADLKTKAAELVAEAVKVEPAELAKRYVQARLDAKMRDEVLAKQGETVTALQTGLKAAEQQNAALAAQCQGLARERDKALVGWQECQRTDEERIAAAKAKLDEAATQLQAEKAKVARLSAVATRNHQALSGAAKLLNDALSANAVETAVEGEA